MGNLIQQQNHLKSLSDEQLQGEGTAPSGSVPPFLVMTEINRRKQMRDAYSAQTARRKPSTTVVEDLLSNPIGMPGRAAGGAAAPGGGSGIGIAAALSPQQPQPEGDIPAFANGGLVGDNLLERIMSRRSNALDAVDGDREKVRARTLIAAGAAMMGNGSSNFMKNIGAGLTGGLDSWQAQTTMNDSRENEALDGLMGIHGAEQAEKLAMLDEQFRRDQEARLTSQFNSEINAPTADMKNHEYFEALPESEQGNYLRVNGSGAGSGGAADRARAMTAYNNLREDAAKAVREKYKYDLVTAAKDPAAAAALEQKMAAEIKQQTDSLFQTSYPDYATLIPELTAGSPAGTPTAAPAGDYNWTDYFDN